MPEFLFVCFFFFTCSRVFNTDVHMQGHVFSRLQEGPMSMPHLFTLLQQQQQQHGRVLIYLSVDIFNIIVCANIYTVTHLCGRETFV